MPVRQDAKPVDAGLNADSVGASLLAPTRFLSFLGQCLIEGATRCALPHYDAADPVVFGLQDLQAIRPDFQAHGAVWDGLQGFGHQAVEGLGAVTANASPGS